MGIQITEEAHAAAAAHAGVPPDQLGAHLGISLDAPLSMATIAVLAAALPHMDLHAAFRTD